MVTTASNSARSFVASIDQGTTSTPCLIVDDPANVAGGAQVEHADGGTVANSLLMQLQADTLRAPLTDSEVTETTALGAAFAAGLAVGVFGQRPVGRGTTRANRCLPRPRPLHLRHAGFLR